MSATLSKGLGTAKLVNKNDGLNLAETKSFLARAQELGYSYIDTAPRYSSGDAERMLGAAGLRQMNFQIGSKFGKRYSRLPYPLNRIQQRFLSRQPELTVWKEFFSPDRTVSEIHDSLRRLQIDYLDFYFLHAVPPTLILDDYADALTRAKESGLIRNIGVSLDLPNQSDLSWCDAIQIPLRGREWTQYSVHQTRVLNSVYLDSNGNVASSLKTATEDSVESIALIGTTSIEHLTTFSMEVDKV